MKKQVRGFTLLELMVTVAIAGIVMAVTLPSLTQMVRVTRQKGVASDFFIDVMLARVEALKRARSVTICPTADDATCVGSASGWTNRRLIFVDQDSNGTFSGSDVLIKVSESVKNGITVTDASGTPSAWLRFRPVGVVVGGARTFDVAATSVSTRKVCVRATGQVSVSEPGAACP